MPGNIEIKARLRDRVAAHATAAQLSGTGPEIIPQTDIFFRSEGARLKLRILAPDRGELIRYERADAAEARRSEYTIARTSDPRNLEEILTAALGSTGTVTKTRSLYLAGQTRIHIDEVEGLGDFLELEVVLRPGQSDAEGRRVATRLLREFDIDEHQLIARAYVDLLASARSTLNE